MIRMGVFLLVIYGTYNFLYVLENFRPVVIWSLASKSNHWFSLRSIWVDWPSFCPARIFAIGSDQLNWSFMGHFWMWSACFLSFLSFPLFLLILSLGTFATSVVVRQFGPYALAIVRFIMGCGQVSHRAKGESIRFFYFQGILVPCVNVLISNWFPVCERSTGDITLFSSFLAILWE
jgi:hypothetical protein